MAPKRRESGKFDRIGLGRIGQKDMMSES